MTRQQTIAVTKQLKEVLGVAVLADRSDVFQKYSTLIENAGRKPGAFRGEGHENAQQLEADRVGLFLVAAAGYDPRAYAGLFERLTLSDGETGFFSRLFGAENPDAKRLVGMTRTAGALPAACTLPPPASASSYREWQRAVAVANVANREERLPGPGPTDSTHALPRSHPPRALQP